MRLIYRMWERRQMTLTWSFFSTQSEGAEEDIQESSALHNSFVDEVVGSWC